MKVLKIYFVAILVNFFPIIIMRLVMGDTIGDENTGYYIFGIFIILSAILNISFLFTQAKSVQKNKIKETLSYYLSSFFFLLLGTLLVIYDIRSAKSYFIGSTLNEKLILILVYYSYFIVNFSYAFYVRHKQLKEQVDRSIR